MTEHVIRSYMIGIQTSHVSPGEGESFGRPKFFTIRAFLLNGEQQDWINQHYNRVNVDCLKTAIPFNIRGIA